MTEPIDFLVNSPDGQRSITIDPILVTPMSGITYATGQYDLKEGNVGIGTLTFNTNNDWSFDGVTDLLSEQDLSRIARFIKSKDHTPAGLSDSPKAGPAEAPATKPQTLYFLTEANGKKIDVRVVVNYPFYDVSLSGRPAAQLEQDHHSNWFVTKGQMDDGLVQAIGKRIAKEITGY
ncbi:hypothetical protein HQ865_15710 [Mucilaginibacter mali]|uniref:Uncharacterized protein n=1 Tax=Mucilaginibacter mali TaxID=2740462 RepID=A0A7D4UPU6_9SPHI|nr:hypothetical protein [Mucilaginibacter mali]QKJ31140.1 hypothetical protein HQ865_15710 [Mucilaginibacter mali]